MGLGRHGAAAGPPPAGLNAVSALPETSLPDFGLRRALAASLAPALVIGARGGQHVFVLVAFVLIARTLGPEALGGFVAAQGIANILAPFVECGGTSFVTRDLTRGEPVAAAFDRAFSVILRRTPVFAAVSGLVGWLAFSADFILPFVLVAVAEMAIARCLDLTYAVNFATGRSHRNAIFDVTVGVVRCLAAGLLWLSGGGLLAWCLAYTLQFGLVVAVATLLTLGAAARPSMTRLPADRRASAMSFALSTSARSSLAELDRVMLSRLSSLEAAGLYGAGSRLVYIATMPFYVFQMMAYPAFFRAGQAGYAAARAVAVRQAVRLAPAGLAVSGLLWIAAPYVDRILGSAYSGTTGVVRGLCVVVALASVSEPFGNALNGAGEERLRRDFQVVGLLFNAALNLCLVPTIGFRGSVIAAVASHCLLLLLFVFGYRLLGRGATAAAPTGTAP